MVEDSGAMRVSSSSSSFMDISAALRLRPLGAPLAVEAGVAFLALVVGVLALADCGEAEAAAEEEEVVVALKPFLRLLYC